MIWFNISFKFIFPDSILDPAIHPDQIHFNLQDQRRRSLGSSQGPPPYIPDTRMIGEPGSIHDGSELIRKLSGSRIPSSKASVSSPIKFANHPPPSISQSQRMSRRINERAPLQPVVQTSTRFVAIQIMYDTFLAIFDRTLSTFVKFNFFIRVFSKFLWL